VHVVALCVISFIRDAAGDRRHFRRGSILLAAAGVAAGMLLILRYDALFTQVPLLKDYQGPGLGRWQERHISTLLFQMHPFIPLAAFASLAVAVRKRDPLYLIVAWLVLLAAVFNVQRIRYVLPVFPLLSLMAAYGLQALRQEDVRRFIAYGVVTTSMTIAFSVYLPFAANMSIVNLKHAGEYLDTLGAREVQVITVPPRKPLIGSVVSVALLDLFTGKQLRHAPLLPEPYPPQQDILRSSLRFAWEFPAPDYYDAASSHRTDVPVIVLMNRKQTLPEAVSARLRRYRLSASFRLDDGIFQYAPQAFVYEGLDAGSR
jgi:hypothetical protein